jgi:hypothetical protein
MSQVKLDDVTVNDKEDRRDDPLRENLGTRRVPKLRMANFPEADDIVRQGLLENERSAEAVDILLVNPPTPDGGCGFAPSTAWDAVPVKIWCGPRFPWPKWRRCCIHSIRWRLLMPMPSAWAGRNFPAS